MHAFRNNVFHYTWNWTLPFITFAGDLWMTNTVGIKSLVNCSFISSSKGVFPPKVINKENKITRLCIGKFFCWKIFSFSSFSYLYCYSNLEIFMALSFKIHFQNLLKEGLMESIFSLSRRILFAFPHGLPWPKLIHTDLVHCKSVQGFFVCVCTQSRYYLYFRCCKINSKEM